MATTQKANGHAQKSKILQFRNNVRPGTEYYYADADPKMLVAAIDAVTRAGAAIMLGRTSDGGAYSVLILDGDDKAREYPHGPDELADVCRAIVATYSED